MDHSNSNDKIFRLGKHFPSLASSKLSFQLSPNLLLQSYTRKRSRPSPPHTWLSSPSSMLESLLSSSSPISDSRYHLTNHILPSSSSALPLRRWISKVLNKSLFQKRETVIKELAVLPESEHLKRPKLDTVGWGNGIHFRKRPSKDAKKWKKDKLFQVKCHRILKHSCNIFCVCSLPCGLMFRNPGAIKAIEKPQTQYCLPVKREFESDQYSANVPILCKNEWMSQLCFLE